MPSVVPQPFASDGEFLAAMCDYLRVRCRRITAQQDAEATGTRDWAGRLTREHKCDALIARDEESTLKAELDARLQAHRADPLRTKLGIDQLTELHRLSDDERLILLAATIPGIGPKVSEDVFRSLTSGYGSLSVSDAILLLGPTNIIEWLRFRKLFHADAPLRRAGLIILGRRNEPVTPDALPQSEVRLSMKTFAIVIGIPDAATEITAETQS
jgi:hypothetical protein